MVRMDSEVKVRLNTLKEVRAWGDDALGSNKMEELKLRIQELEWVLEIEHGS